jgi:hypothetical protein
VLKYFQERMPGLFVPDIDTGLGHA